MTTIRKRNSGRRRHTVTIKRPPTGLGDRGQRTGTASTVASSVPCEIETLGGDELTQARQQFARARYRVRLTNDSSWNLTTEDYLVFGSRNLHIGHIDDIDQLGVELELLCAEEK